MKNFKTIGSVLVTVDYSRGCDSFQGDLGTIIVSSTREGGVYSKSFVKNSEFIPNIDDARKHILAFCDEKKEGLSGMGCPAKVILEEKDHWIFEVKANIKRELWNCQCCSYIYDGETGKKKETRLGRHPEVTQFADAPGWGVVCNDCGMTVCEPTMDEAIASWNAQNEFNKYSDKKRVLRNKNDGCWEEIPF